jgi:hypothetical protein
MGKGDFCLMSRSKLVTEELRHVGDDIPCDSGIANLFPKYLKLMPTLRTSLFINPDCRDSK